MAGEKNITEPFNTEQKKKILDERIAEIENKITNSLKADAPFGTFPEDDIGETISKNKLPAPILNLREKGEQIAGDTINFTKDTINNIPESAGQFGNDLFKLLNSPLKAADTFGQLVTGAGEAGLQQIPGLEGLDPVNKPVFDSFVKLMQNRHGSFEKSANTLKKDPVGWFC